MLNPEITRPSLLSRVRDPADQAAWEEFDGRYRELILRYCRRRNLSVADAEDVRQMVMIRMVRALPAFTYDPARGRFRDYLYRAVRNVISDLKSRPSETVRTVDTDTVDALLGGAEPEPDDIWEQEWLDHHMRLAMAQVRSSFEARSIEVFDRLLAGESIETVAAAFGMTSQAVHKVKQRVRDRVQDLIAAQIREEDTVDG